MSGDVPMPAWLGLVLVILAVIGGYAVVWAVHDGIATAWKYWRDRREFGPDESSEHERAGLCAGCWDDSEHCDGAYDTCNCTCGWDEDWAERELPSREELGFTSGQPAIDLGFGAAWDLDQPALEGVLWEPSRAEHLAASRERLMPAWRAEIAAAELWWEELPSGTGFTRAMAARVRELAP